MCAFRCFRHSLSLGGRVFASWAVSHSLSRGLTQGGVVYYFSCILYNKGPNPTPGWELNGSVPRGAEPSFECGKRGDRDDGSGEAGGSTTLVTGSLPAPPGVFLPVLETSVAGGPRRLGGGVSVGGPRRPATAVPGGARRLLRHVAQMWARVCLRVRARADGWAVVARSWESARARAMG